MAPVLVIAQPINLECGVGKQIFAFSFETGNDVSDVSVTNAEGKTNSYVSVPTSFTPRSVTIKLITKPVTGVDEITMTQSFIINRKSLAIERQSTIVDSGMGIESGPNVSEGECAVTELDTSDNAF